MQVWAVGEGFRWLARITIGCEMGEGQKDDDTELSPDRSSR